MINMTIPIRKIALVGLWFSHFFSVISVFMVLFDCVGNFYTWLLRNCWYQMYYICNTYENAFIEYPL
jgi:hypothetical protein